METVVLVDADYLRRKFGSHYDALEQVTERVGPVDTQWDFKFPGTAEGRQGAIERVRRKNAEHAERLRGKKAHLEGILARRWLWLPAGFLTGRLGTVRKNLDRFARDVEGLEKRLSELAGEVSVKPLEGPFRMRPILPIGRELFEVCYEWLGQPDAKPLRIEARYITGRSIFPGGGNEGLDFVVHYHLNDGGGFDLTRWDGGDEVDSHHLDRRLFLTRDSAEAAAQKIAADVLERIRGHLPERVQN